jgi:hypothetical protein
MSDASSNDIFKWFRETLFGESTGVTDADQRLINEAMISTVNNQAKEGRIDKSRETFQKHWPGYNYLGPGTNIEIKLANRTRVGSIIPVNELDAIAFRHDVLYRLYDPAVRQLADNEMVEAIDNMDVLTNDAVMARLMIMTKIKIEQNLGINLGRELSGDPGVSNSESQVANAKQIADTFLGRIGEAGVRIPTDGTDTSLGNLDAYRFADLMSDVSQLANFETGSENVSFSNGSSTSNMSDVIYTEMFRSRDQYDIASIAEYGKALQEFQRNNPFVRINRLIGKFRDTDAFKQVKELLPDISNWRAIEEEIIKQVQDTRGGSSTVSLTAVLESVVDSLNNQVVNDVDGNLISYEDWRSGVFPDLPQPRERGGADDEEKDEEKLPQISAKENLYNFIDHIKEIGLGFTDDELASQGDRTPEQLRAQLKDVAILLKQNQVHHDPGIDLDRVISTLHSNSTLESALRGSDVFREKFPQFWSGYRKSIEPQHGAAPTSASRDALDVYMQVLAENFSLTPDTAEGKAVLDAGSDDDFRKLILGSLDDPQVVTILQGADMDIDFLRSILHSSTSLESVLKGGTTFSTYYPEYYAERQATERATELAAAGEDVAQIANYGYDIDQQIALEQEGLQNYNTSDTYNESQSDHIHSLLPFLPIAGTDIFDEQTTLESDKLKQQNLLIGQYRPPNWPLGNVDNPIWLGNLKNLGLRLGSGSSFEMPPRFKGGSLTDGAKLYGSYTKIPKVSNTDRYGPYNRM